MVTSYQTDKTKQFQNSPGKQTKPVTQVRQDLIVFIPRQ